MFMLNHVDSLQKRFEKRSCPCTYVEKVARYNVDAQTDKETAYTACSPPPIKKNPKIKAYCAKSMAV